jgi:dolichyl-phosphate-mannose-protein mannosyltransferase
VTLVEERPQAAAPRRMPNDRFLGWALPLLIMVVGGFLRFRNLDLPKGKVFDEVYYVTGAQQLIANGVEWDLEKKAADFVVHPPLGKWVIAAGIKAFGDNEYGWRVGVALLGTLSILIMARVARRLFQSTLLGVIAGLLLAIDGLHFAHSRTGLLDLTLMFWLLVAFAALLIDRDRRQENLFFKGKPGENIYRWIAGASLGLALGTKWSALYFIVVFAIMALLWDVSGWRRAGYPRPYRRALLRSLPPATFHFGLLPIGVYLLTWTGWFRSEIGWGRSWAEGRDSSFGFVPAALRSLWNYHAEMYRFHRNLDSPHPYQASPWSWLIMSRPTAFFYASHEAGSAGCTVAKCSQAIIGLGNPLTWWAGTIAFFLLLWAWAARRDWRAGAILSGFLAGYLPWFAFEDRTIYSFYAIAFTPWVVLAVVYLIGMLLGSSSDPTVRMRRSIAAGFVVLVAVGVFFYLLPVLDATVIPETEWRARMWLPSWI